MLFAIIISVLGGVTTVVSRLINAKLTNKIGVMGSTLFNYIVGLIFTLVILTLTSKGFGFNSLSTISFKSIPFWGYLGGFVGVAVVGLSSYVSLKASAFYVSLFIFIGQLFTGIAIDYFTIGILSPGKIAGGILVLLGLLLNLKIDKKTAIE